MFNFFLRNVIGGETGKRESALFILTIWIAITVLILRREWLGVPTEVSMTIWQVLTPFAFGAWAAAFGWDWWSKQGRQP